MDRLFESFLLLCMVAVILFLGYSAFGLVMFGFNYLTDLWL